MLRFVRRLVVRLAVIAGLVTALLAWRERRLLENQERFGLP